jgi:hypothetical protein
MNRMHTFHFYLSIKSFNYFGYDCIIPSNIYFFEGYWEYKGYFGGSKGNYRQDFVFNVY